MWNGATVFWPFVPALFSVFDNLLYVFANQFSPFILSFVLNCVTVDVSLYECGISKAWMAWCANDCSLECFSFNATTLSVSPLTPLLTLYLEITVIPWLDKSEQ